MLQKLQNRAGRIILKINPYSHISTSHIHEVLNWKLLSVRQEEHIYIMMYKSLNNLFPEYIKRPIPIKTDRYFFRSIGNLSLPRPKTNNCKRTFYYRGTSLYNKLPANTRSACTIQNFKSNLTIFFTISSKCAQ